MEGVTAPKPLREVRPTIKHPESVKQSVQAHPATQQVIESLPKDDPERAFKMIADSSNVSNQRANENSRRQENNLRAAAMGEFTGVLDNIGKLKAGDSKYIDAVGRLAARIATLNQGEYRRDGFQAPIDKMSEQFGQEVRQRIQTISKQNEALGLNKTQEEDQMEALLQQIAGTTDESQKAALIQQATSFFQQTIETVVSNRGDQRKQRLGIDQKGDMNLRWARGKQREAEEISKGRLADDSAPVVYARYSGDIVRVSQTEGKEITTRENVVFADNEQGLVKFKGIMVRLRDGNQAEPSGQTNQNTTGLPRAA